MVGKEEDKVTVVALSHALVKPRAVVVEARHAAVARDAMLRARRPGDEARRAELGRVDHLEETGESISLLLSRCLSVVVSVSGVSGAVDSMAVSMSGVGAAALGCVWEPGRMGASNTGGGSPR